MKFIERRKGVMGGSWVFKKTRVPVKMMYQHICVIKDYTLEQVQELWGFITPVQIKGGLYEYRKLNRKKRLLKIGLGILAFFIVGTFLIFFLRWVWFGEI